MTEQQLRHGYRNTVVPRPEPLRFEPCACGGILTAPPRDATRIRLEVERHQSTARHQDWRERYR